MSNKSYTVISQNIIHIELNTADHSQDVLALKSLDSLLDKLRLRFRVLRMTSVLHRAVSSLYALNRNQ